MYKDDLQYKSTNELNLLLEERQKEIEWINSELDSRKGVSKELIKCTEKLNAIIKESKLPYVIISIDRKETGPVVLIAQREHIGAYIDERNHTNTPGIYFSATYCVTLYYSRNKEHCNTTSYGDCVYNTNYIDNPEEFVKTFSDCFFCEEDAKKVVADAVSRSCLDYYADAKNDVRKALGLDFKSTLKIEDEYAEYML